MPSASSVASTAVLLASTPAGRGDCDGEGPMKGTEKVTGEVTGGVQKGLPGT